MKATLNFITYYSSSYVYFICLYIFYNNTVVNLRSQINKAFILKLCQNIKLYSYTYTISIGLEHTFRVEQISLYLYIHHTRLKSFFFFVLLFSSSCFSSIINYLYSRKQYEFSQCCCSHIKVGEDGIVLRLE